MWNYLANNPWELKGGVHIPPQIPSCSPKVANMKVTDHASRPNQSRSESHRMQWQTRHAPKKERLNFSSRNTKALNISASTFKRLHSGQG